MRLVLFGFQSWVPLHVKCIYHEINKLVILNVADTRKSSRNT